MWEPGSSNGNRSRPGEAVTMKRKGVPRSHIGPAPGRAFSEIVGVSILLGNRRKWNHKVWNVPCLLGRRGEGDIVQPTSLIYTGFFIFEMTNSSSCRKNVATVTLYIPAGCRLQITYQLALTVHSHWPHLFPLIQDAFYCRQPVPWTCICVCGMPMVDSWTCSDWDSPCHSGHCLRLLLFNNAYFL